MSGDVIVSVNRTSNPVTNPVLIPRKSTKTAGRYFLYRYCTKCTHLRKGLKFNEGGDRRNHRKAVSSPEVRG